MPARLDSRTRIIVLCWIDFCRRKDVIMNEFLKGLRPQPGETVEAFIQRGVAVSAPDRSAFSPRAGDTFGEYLIRLRHANRLELDEVEIVLGAFPPESRVNCSELLSLEGGNAELGTELRLRVLATLYGIPQEWLLQAHQSFYKNSSYPGEETQRAYLFSPMTHRSAVMDALDEDARRLLEVTFRNLVVAAHSIVSEGDNLVSQSADVH